MSSINENSQKTGIYRVSDDVNNFKIRVKLKKVRSALQHSNVIDREEVYVFQWQTKVFSRTEIEYYSKESNCVTDLERKYNQDVKDIEEGGKLFTYVDDDEFSKIDENVTDINTGMTDLHKQILNLKMNDEEYEMNNVEEYDFLRSLKKCIKRPFIVNKYKNMVIMADLGSSDGETKIWLKSEYVLCNIKYDELNKILYVFPDFVKNCEHPYVLEVGGDGKEIYEYYIEHVSLEKDKKSDSNEKEVIQKILKRNQEEKSQIVGSYFVVAPKNVFRVHLFFEILTAMDFENDNLYVQYNIELPELWKCEDEALLCGSTSTCKTKGFENVANFGHNFDIYLEYNVKDVEEDNLPKSPYVYFQVISRDYWDRYRCEGICYKAIPVFQTRIHVFELDCLRVCPRSTYGELRRYFVGDYGSIEDVSWAGLPKDYENSVLNKYGVRTIGTGTVKVRLNVLNQSKCFIKEKNQLNVGGIGSSSLMKSVQDVVDAFRKAQERMQIARKLVLERKKIEET